MLAFALLALLQTADLVAPTTDARHVVHVRALTRDGSAAVGVQVFVDGDRRVAPTYSGVTDAAGRATVAATRGSMSYSLDVVLVGPDSVGCVSLKAFPFDRAPLELDVELVPLVEATIAIEPPRAACEIEVLSCGLGRGPWYQPARFGLVSRAMTGSDGRAVLRLPEDSTFSVVCRSIGFERRQVGRTGEPTVILFDALGRAARGEPALESSRLTIELLASDPSVVRGRTLTFRPVPPRVTSSPGEAPARVDSPTPRTVTRVTDATGSVTIQDYPDLPIALELHRGPADLPYTVAAVTGPSEPVDGTRTVQVLLTPGTVFTGRVMSAGGLEPIEGLELAFRSEHELERATSDRDGRFRYVAQPGERLEVELLTVPEPWRVAARHGHWPRFPHDSDPDAPLSLELVRNRPVEVHVEDRDGAPIVGATVRARRGDWAPSYASTGADGRARFTDSGWGECDLTVERLGFETRSLAYEPGTRTEVVLERAAPQDFEVLVIDDSLNPVGGLSVIIRDDRWILAGARTDANGRAEMVLPPGTSSRHVDVEGSGYHSTSKHVHRPPRGPFVVAVARAGALAGRVVDLAGRPVAGARVLHVAASPVVRIADDHGRFSFRRADLSRPLVTVRAEGFRAGGGLELDGEGELCVRLIRREEAASPPAAELPSEALSPAQRRALATTLVARLPKSTLDGVDLAAVKRRWLEALSRPPESAPSEVARPRPRDSSLEAAAYDPELIAEWIVRTNEPGARMGEALRPYLLLPGVWPIMHSPEFLFAPYRALAGVDRALALELAFELAETLEAGAYMSDHGSTGMALLFVAIDPPLGRVLITADRAQAVAALRNGSPLSDAGYLGLRLVDGEVFARELSREELAPWPLLRALRVLAAPRSRLLELGVSETVLGPIHASAHVDRWAPTSIDPELAKAGEAR